MKMFINISLKNIWQLGIFAEVLIHGNFDFAQSKQIRDIINESMENVKPWMEKYNEEQFHLQSYVLQPNETIRYEVPLKDTANINSCIEYYIQINTNTDNLKLRVLTDLFATIIREPCFDQLRTKRTIRVCCILRDGFRKNNIGIQSFDPIGKNM